MTEETVDERTLLEKVTDAACARHAAGEPLSEMEQRAYDLSGTPDDLARLGLIFDMAQVPPDTDITRRLDAMYRRYDANIQVRDHHIAVLQSAIHAALHAIPHVSVKRAVRILNEALR